jgi:hypothetical protein
MGPHKTWVCGRSLDWIAGSKAGKTECVFVFWSTVYMHPVKWTQAYVLGWSVSLQTKVMVIPLNAMRTYAGAEVQCCTFLTLAVDGGKWSASCFGRFILGGKNCGTH